jgi:hypothetical protein
MTKATINDVIGLGFAAAQFGNQSDFSADAAGGYVFDVLADVALQVRNLIGAGTYDAADSAGATDELKLNFSYIKQVEMHLSAAELWRRRASYADSSMSLSRNITDLGELIDSYRRSADKAEEKAWEYIGRITGVSREGSISTGVLETGLYPAVT